MVPTLDFYHCMEEAMKKAFYLIVSFVILIFVFFCIECVIYTLFLSQNPLCYLSFILFLVVLYFAIIGFNQMNLPNKIIAPALVLIAAFLGLYLLRFFLFCKQRHGIMKNSIGIYAELVLFNYFCQYVA